MGSRGMNRRGKSFPNDKVEQVFREPVSERAWNISSARILTYGEVDKSEAP